MSRSKWKGPFVDAKLLRNLNETKKNHKILVISRNSEIVPRLVGLTFKVHNGKGYSEVAVNDDMIGHKFGEFAATRATFLFKRKKSKK